MDELALYEMTGEGLVEIANPSAALLAERRGGRPGSAVTAAREGTRSLLVEIQALVGPAAAGSPRRVALGFDGGAARAAARGARGRGACRSPRARSSSPAPAALEVGEPAADLAVVAALVSSARGAPLPAGAVFFGEIGLLGEVRRVPAAAPRLKEAAALGFRDGLPAGRQRGRGRGVSEVAARPGRPRGGLSFACIGPAPRVR